MIPVLIGAFTGAPLPARELESDTFRYAWTRGFGRTRWTVQYLIQHGYTQLTTYQPADLFWPFQWIEGGWLLVVSLVLLVATVWLDRRRAA